MNNSTINYNLLLIHNIYKYISPNTIGHQFCFFHVLWSSAATLCDCCIVYGLFHLIISYLFFKITWNKDCWTIVKWCGLWMYIFVLLIKFWSNLLPQDETVELNARLSGWLISANTVVYVPFDQFFCKPLILHHCKLQNKAITRYHRSRPKK